MNSFRRFLLALSPLVSVASLSSLRARIAFALFLTSFLWPQHVFASSQATTTTLAITAAGNPTSSVAPNTVVTLTATVTSSGAPVTAGTVNFCDATALSCTDIHLAGTAQLTGAGVATARFRPSIGTHSYKAVFVGTTSYTTSASVASTLVVPGTTTTSLVVTGAAGSYTLTGSVAASGAGAPSSALSFLDLTNGSYVLGTPSLSKGHSTLSFTNTGTASLGGSSFSPPLPVAGDLDLDGITDLVVPDGGGSVKIMLGNGDGTFRTVASVTTGSSPMAGVIADFNADGKPDIAIANENSNNLTILLGKGDGAFLVSTTSPATGSQPRGITVGDFNDDGKLDLAVTNSGDNTLTVLLGNGDGTFTAAAVVSTPNAPLGIVSGDFNGDGNLDLAITNTYYSAGCAHVFLGGGDGTFALAPALPTYSVTSCYALAAADLNHDGKLDLLVADFDNYRVYTYFGAGNGSFPRISITAQSDNHYSPVSLAIGDLNGDGILDFATTSSIQDALTVGLGNGDGTFVQTNTSSVSSGNASNSVVLADFNGDGTSDAAIENGASTLTLFTSSVSQAFQASLANISPAGTGTHQLQAAYPGDSAYSSSVSNTVLLTAQQIATNTSLSVNPAAGSLYGQQIVLTASSSPFSAQGHSTDGETVSFLSGNTVVGTASLSTGQASLNLTSLAAGVNSLKAVFSGDTNFAGSISSVSSYDVTNTTSLALSAKPASGSYGQHATLTATLTSTAQTSATNGESITFKNGSTILGSAVLSSGVATFILPTIPVSTASLTASYTGDTNFAPASSNTVPFTISQATPVVTWSPPIASVVYTGKPAGSALFNASSATAGTIVYMATPASGSSAVVNAFSTFSAGSYVITATLTPTDKADYTSASTTVAFIVTPAPLAVVPQNATRVYAAANPTLPGSVTGALNSDTFTVTGSTTAVTTSPIGSYPITYTVTGGNVANYSITQASGTLTVTSATSSISWTAPVAITYGTPLSSAQLNATSSLAGTFAFTPSLGTVLPAGSQMLSVTFTPTDATDYTAQTATVPLTVNKAALFITANSLARVYGAINPSFTGTLSGAVNGDTFSESFSSTAAVASIVGNYPIVPFLVGANLSNYTVTAANGSLAVSQAGTATTFALSNTNLTLTATLASLTSGTPTGTVGFYEGQTLVGTGTLSNGSASYTVASFPSGDVVVTAEYSGDANFTQSSSPPILILTVLPAQTQLSIAAGSSATDTLGLTAATGFTGTIQFSCTGLPQYATCNFSPSSVSFGSSTSASTTVTIQTGVSANLIRPGFFSRHELSELAALLCIPGFCLTSLARRHLPRLLSVALVALLASTVCLSLTACGGAPQTPSGSSTQTPVGSSTVQVISSGPGGLSQTTSLNVTVH